MRENICTYQLATPQAEVPNFPLTIGISSGLAAAVTGFVVKWLFEQVVLSYKQKIDDLGKSIERLDRDIVMSAEKYEQLRLDLSGFKCDIAQEYLTREDWIRSSVGLENKIERLGQKFDDKFDRIIERLPIRNEGKV